MVPPPLCPIVPLPSASFQPSLTRPSCPRRPPARPPAPSPQPPSKPADFEKDVVIILRETETFFLLDIPARCVHAEALDAPAIKARNEAYKKLLQRRSEGESGQENATQTITRMLKMREASTVDEPPVEMACQTTESTIWDTSQETIRCEPLPWGQEPPPRPLSLLSPCALPLSLHLSFRSAPRI